VKILITGGFGYLSNRLANDLSVCGHKIVLATRNQNLTQFSSEKIEVKKIDWDSNSSILKLCKKIDVVIHCAGVDSKTSTQNPKLAYDFNATKTENFVKVASSLMVKKFIFLSTAHVYRTPLLGRITEDSPVENLHPYAKSRHDGELAVLRHSEVTQMEGIVVRLSNIYGAPENYESNCWNLVINDICRQAVFNEKIEIRDRYNTIRDFLPISSFAKVMRFIVNSNNKVGPIVNIGSGFSLGVWDFARFISKRYKFLYDVSVSINTDNHKELNDITWEPTENYLDYSSKLDHVISFKLSEHYFEIDNLLINLKKIKDDLEKC
jgi:UDP-glucose 4-epimerase